MWTWIKDKWNRFQNWVASWAPGLKTKIVTFLGAIGSFAAILQQWVTGIPLDKFVSGTTIVIVSAVLFTLAFWFRGLANRNV
jgi:hypothetical protein